MTVKIGNPLLRRMSPWNPNWVKKKINLADSDLDSKDFGSKSDEEDSFEEKSHKKSKIKPQKKKETYSSEEVSSDFSSPKKKKYPSSKNTHHRHKKPPKKNTSKTSKHYQSSYSTSSPSPNLKSTKKYTKPNPPKSHSIKTHHSPSESPNDSSYDHPENGDDSLTESSHSSSSSPYGKSSYSSSSPKKHKVSSKKQLPLKKPNRKKPHDFQPSRIIQNVLTKIQNNPGPLETYNFHSFNANDHNLDHFFSKNRQNYARQLYQFFNSLVFENKLPQQLKIEWSGRLRSTAGFARLQSSGDQYQAEIHLSIPILNNSERLCHTLIHELCHCAVWVIDHKKDHHGPYWKNWMRRAKARFPQVQITACHNYDIEYKYTYHCHQCHNKIGRHKIWSNVEKYRCKCGGKFLLLAR